MINLLIDTNGWMNFVEIDPDDELLKAIEEWVAKKNIQLLVPANLLAEWNKKKEKHIKKLKAQQTEGLRPLAKRNSSLVAIADEHFKEVHQKINRIDELLQNGILCEPSDAVFAEISKRQLYYQAPFHNSQKSFNDALIFFSMLEDCRRRLITEVFFVTYDSDFCYPSDNKRLHPELVQQDISIVLFKNIGVVVNRIKKEFPISVKVDSSINEDFPTIYEESTYALPKAYSLIDQLFSLCSLLKTQQPFVPSGILSRTYPFKISNAEKAYTYFSSFSIKTNNHQLLNLFKAVKSVCNEKVELHDYEVVSGVENSEKKLWNIFQWLNSNLIFSIVHWSEYDQVSIEAQNNSVERGIEYAVFSLNLSHALTEVKNSNANTIEMMLESAYYHAYFGRFGDSARVYYEILQIANSKNSNLLSFICFYNIKQLDHLCRSYCMNMSSELEEILLKVRRTSLQEIFLKYSFGSIFYRDCMKYLMDKTFLSECMEDIVETVEQIRQHYYSQLRGGYSSNSYVSTLIWTFSHFESYIDRNRIVFKCFSDFSKLFDRFLEGLVIAHSMSEKQKCRLDTFDDYLILRFLYYGDSERLFKYLKRYDVREIRYKPTNDPEDQVSEVILKFWQQHLELQTMISPSNEVNGLYFRQKYQRMISSSLTILALVSFDASVYQKFGRMLALCLKNEIFVKKLQMDFLSNIIREKGQLFDIKDLNEILEIVINTQELHTDNLLQSFAKIKEQHRLVEIELTSDEQYALILNSFYYNCPKCNQIHNPSLLYQCYKLFSLDLKERLRTRIETDLEEHFNRDNYYIFSIYGIIDYQRFFQIYFDSFPASTGPLERDHIFGNSEILSSGVSQLVNLMFQENPDTRAFSLKKFKGLSLYYDWLTDIENFDYNKFNPEWILEYQTQSYLKNVFSNEKVRKAVRNYILRKNHPRLSELYVLYAPIELYRD